MDIKKAYKPDSQDVLKPSQTWHDEFAGIVEFIKSLELDEMEKPAKDIEKCPPVSNRIFQLANLLLKIGEDFTPTEAPPPVPESEQNAFEQKQQELRLKPENLYYVLVAEDDKGVSGAMTSETSVWPEDLQITGPDYPSRYAFQDRRYHLSTDTANFPGLVTQEAFDRMRPSVSRPSTTPTPSLESKTDTINIPGGPGTEALIRSTREKLSESFSTEVLPYYKLFTENLIYSGYDQNTGEIKLWFDKFADLNSYVEKYLEKETGMSTETANTVLNDIDRKIKEVIEYGKGVYDRAQEQLYTIPAGIVAYDLSREFVFETPTQYEAILIGKETPVKQEDGSTVHVREYWTTDGSRLAITKENLEGEISKTFTTTYYIPDGSLVFNLTDQVIEEKTLDTPIHMVYRNPVDIMDLIAENPALKDQLPRLKKYDKENLDRVPFFHVHDPYLGISYLVRGDDRKPYGKKPEKMSNLLHLLTKIGEETIEDQPPYAWRNFTESPEIPLHTSPVQSEKPFRGPPEYGNVPFLSMPNVGDVMTDRTNTRGLAGDPEYEGKRHEQLDSETKQSLQDLMKSRYEDGLTCAIRDGAAKAIIDYFQDMVDRYNQS